MHRSKEATNNIKNLLFSVLSSRNNKREEENKNDVEKDNSSRLITVKTLSMSELMLFLPPDNDSMTNGAVISLLNLHLKSSWPAPLMNLR